MHEAALKTDEDPGRLSFLHPVRAVRRKMSSLACVKSRRQLEHFRKMNIKLAQGLDLTPM